MSRFSRNPAGRRTPRRGVEPTPPASDANALPSWRHLFTDVLLPFALSRALLAFVAWIFANQPRGLTWIAEYAKRGWGFTPVRWIDVWARWDSAWYLDIAKQGYLPGAYAAGQYSNIAFFPVFPQTVRLLYRALPAGWQGDQAAVLLGITVANLCALAALGLLYWHVRERFGDRAMAARAVVFLLAFPTAFFLSCFYTESMFLLLALATYHTAWKGRWATAGVLGALLAATRPTGVLILVPLLWMRLAAADFKFAQLGARVWWLALVPTGFAAYALYLWRLTGDASAVFTAQAAWNRHFASPLALFDDPIPPYGDPVHLDRVLTLAFAALAAWLVSRRAWRTDGLVICAFLVAFVFSGKALSASRFVLVAFPAYVWLASLRSEAARLAYLGAAAVVQTTLWVCWVLMRWVA
jgi:hypothetical protein